MKKMFRNKSGFSVVELLTVIAIILVLASLLTTSIISAREKSYQAKCINNERQLVCAVLLFAYDEEHFPEALAQIDKKYINSPLIKSDFLGENKAYALSTPSGYYNNIMGILKCPKADPEESEFSYGYNIYLQNINFRYTIDSSKIVVLADSEKQFLESSADTVKRHKRGMNAAFADGHVKYALNIFPYPVTGIASGDWILPPPQTDDTGFTIEIVNLTENDDGTLTITTNVTSDDDEGTPALSHIDFGLPADAIDMAAETVRTSGRYNIEIVLPDPDTGIFGVKLETKGGQGLGENGIVETEFFEFEVPLEAIGDSFTMEVGTKAGESIEITFYLVQKN